MDFQKQKNGYDMLEVDEYIESIKLSAEKKQKELEMQIDLLKSKCDGFASSLELYKSKKDSISTALISAVEKANQIEESSKNVYRLKIQQLNVLYKKWEFLLEEMLQKYPDLSETASLSETVQTFKQSIKNILENDFQIENGGGRTVKPDPIRALLQKINQRSESSTPVETKTEVKILRKKQDDLGLKPISVGTFSKAEQFLASDEEPELISASHFGSFAQNIKSDDGRGFDLSEAVNPKEDLDEIMKAFDFFKENT